MIPLARRVLPILLAALATLATRATGQGTGPPDSTLATACAGGYKLAEGLLLVVFRADVPGTARRDLVKGLGGRLGPPAVNGGVAGEYVILPPDRRLDVAADQLIRANGVESVAEVQCPPPPAPPPAADTAARRDSTARGDTAGAPGPVPGDTTRSRQPAGADTAGAPATRDSIPPGGT